MSYTIWKQGKQGKREIAKVVSIGSSEDFYTKVALKANEILNNAAMGTSVFIFENGGKDGKVRWFGAKPSRKLVVS